MILDRQARLYVAGGRGVIGAALLRQLADRGITGVIDSEPNYTRQAEVESFFQTERPDYVFVVGGKSGGIGLNQTQPASLMSDNLLLISHVLEAAHRFGVKKLLFLASSCIYPRDCPQPMKPDYIGTGPLEPTNVAYATAQIAGLRLCQAYRDETGDNFIVAIPSNEFGPDDEFGPDAAHVIGALMRRMHMAKLSGYPEVKIWGSGKQRRQFIYSEDVAGALIYLMERYDAAEPINVAGHVELSIAELAEMIKMVVGYEGRLVMDMTRPDGMPFKALDGEPLAQLGWRASTPFGEALRMTYQSYLETQQV